MKVKDVQHGKTTRKKELLHESKRFSKCRISSRCRRSLTNGSWIRACVRFFDDTASITDYTGNLELSFLDFSMDEEPKYSIEECKARDATYATPLKVRMRLRNKETGEIKEQEIFMGDFRR